jgi:nucleoid-associated protein YgaU
VALAKLTIRVETAPGQFGQEITVLFNPNQITITKAVNWREAPTAQRDVPASQHTHADPARLTMDLLFDTYEAGTDVRDHTDQIVHLMTVEKHGNMHRPPICRLFWGRAEMFFQGVLENLTQRFSLFLEDGWPVRATLGCTFKEWRGDEEEARRQNRQSANVVKTHLLRRGETLSSIAFDEYHDPALWRPIAEANGITDPFSLPYGKSLVIPTLGSRASGW